MNAFHRLAVLCLTLLVGVAHAQTPPADSPALAAARKRQDAIKSIEFTVRVKQVVEPNVMRQSERDGKGTYPKERTTIESVNRLVFDGAMIRFEDNHAMPHANLMQWIEMRSLYVTNGEVVKFYQAPAEGPSRENCIAKISTVQNTSVSGLRIYMPLHLACRGASNPSCRNALTFNQFKALGVLTKIKGADVEEYQRTATEVTSGNQMWVDGKCDHLPRRIRYITPNGGGSGITDITLEREQSAGLWLPKSWVHTDYTTDDKVKMTYVMTVDSVSVNPPHDRKEFDLVFPKGVEVFDDRTGEYTLSNGDNGGPILTGSGGGEGNPTSQLSRYWWVPVMGVLIMALVIGWVVYRRRARNEQSE